MVGELVPTLARKATFPLSTGWMINIYQQFHNNSGYIAPLGLQFIIQIYTFDEVYNIFASDVIKQIIDISVFNDRENQWQTTAKKPEPG